MIVHLENDPAEWMQSLKEIFQYLANKRITLSTAAFTAHCEYAQLQLIPAQHGISLYEHIVAALGMKKMVESLYLLKMQTMVLPQNNQNTLEMIIRAFKEHNVNIETVMLVPDDPSDQTLRYLSD